MNSDAAKKERKGERNLSVGGAALILLVVFATIIFDHSSRCRNEYGAAPGSL